MNADLIDRKALEQFIEEYDCSDEAMEMRQRAFELRGFARLARSRRESSQPDDMIHMMTLSEEEKNSIDEYARKGVYGNSFIEVLDRLMDEHDITAYGQIAKDSGIDEKKFASIRDKNGTSNRDYLWALSIGMKLAPDEAEELFRSCGQSTFGLYVKSDDDKEQIRARKREGVIGYFIRNGIWDIQTLNYYLDEMNYETLAC
ncbi:MAG: hypothetical protein K5871_09815 [Lachnospiraceae bacterium]|nr:hypothetical protein [Lachnospiraceae bacterium]